MNSSQAVGKIGKTIMARILPGNEMIMEIKEICRKNNIDSAYVSVCIGSLRNVNFVYATTDLDCFYKIKYSEPVVIKGPIELLGVQGIIAKDNDEKYQVHFHAQFSDENMQVYGGHLLDYGNIVLATIDIVINEIVNLNLKRNYHKESGFYFFKPVDRE